MNMNNGDEREHILDGVPILTSGTLEEYLKYSMDVITKYLKNRPGMIKPHVNRMNMLMKNDNYENENDDKKKKFKKDTNIKFKPKCKSEVHDTNALLDNKNQKLMLKKHKIDDKTSEREICLQPQNIKSLEDDLCSACVVSKQIKDYEKSTDTKAGKELKKLKKVIKVVNHKKYCDKSTTDLEMNDTMIKRTESVQSFGAETKLASDQLLKWADETINKVGYNTAFELIQLSYDEKLEKFSTNQELEKKEIIKPIQHNLNFLENSPQSCLKIDPNLFKTDLEIYEKVQNLENQALRKKKGTYSSTYYLPCGEDSLIEEKKSDEKVTVMEDLFALDDIWKDLEDSITNDDVDNSEGTDSDSSIDSISTVINLRNNKFKDVRQDLSKAKSWEEIINDLHEKELAKKIAREVVNSIEEELDTIIDSMKIE